MVVKLVVIIAFLPTLLIAQQESMKKQIDSLVAKKVALTNELVEIDVKIKSLEIQMQDIIGSDSRANFSILEATTLYKKPNVFDGKILELQKEDSVKFISVPENKYFVEVSVSENRGYVLRRNVRDIDYYI